MPIIQQGSVNTTALVVPDLYVQIVPPQNLIINGVPTDIVGVVGTASWGPTNQPVIVGSMAEYASGFGPIMARTGDMATQVATAVQQGARTSGASVYGRNRYGGGYDFGAAVAQLAMSFVSRNTGSFGNQFSATLLDRLAGGKLQIVFAAPGLQPEVFDNISGTGAAFW